MPITKAQCEAFCASGGMRSVAANEAENLKNCCDDLEKQGVPWTDLFVKAIAIFNIISDNVKYPTWQMKISAIFALFNKTPTIQPV